MVAYPCLTVMSRYITGLILQATGLSLSLLMHRGQQTLARNEVPPNVSKDLAVT